MHEAQSLGPVEVAVVFAPAIVAYALLTAIAVVVAGAPASRVSRSWRVAGWLLLVVMTGHVALLWSLRYDFDPAAAVRNGWSGFLVFHTALVAGWIILPGAWRTTRWRRGGVFGMWLLVTSGAVPAPFRYPIVRALAPVVVAIAASGAVAMMVMYWRVKRRRGDGLSGSLTPE